MDEKCVVPFEQSVIVISGATCSVKTCFTHKLLCNLVQTFTYPQPKSVLFCCAIYQSMYDKV